MPDHVSHRLRYIHNKDFLNSIDESSYSDWAVTVCFYCSLHKVCQCLKYVYSATDKDTGTHQLTLSYLEQHNTSLHKKYYCLYTLSRMARYGCIDVSKSLPQAKQLLVQIESLADTLIAQKAKRLCGI